MNRVSADTAVGTNGGSKVMGGEKVCVRDGGSSDNQAADDEKKATAKGADENGEVVVSSVDKSKDGMYDPSKESRLTRLGLTFESFKRAPGSTGGQVVHGAQGDTEKHGDNPMLQQTMKNRHLQMIAVGGSIGTGLFIGSGSALSTGGPASLVIAWTVMGIMILNVVQAIGEMAIMYPVSGGFYTLVCRFLDPAWGVAMGYDYILQWAVTLPLELTAAGFTIQYWDSQKIVPIAVWITIFAIVIIVLNIFGTWGFAEEEFWGSCAKLLIIVIFIFSALVFVNGGGPRSGDYGSYTGGHLWYDPGAFAYGFKGLCSVWVTAAFSLAGTELVGLAATEHPNPRKALPSAIKATVWRISLVYIVSLTMIGLLVPYDDPRLLGGSSDSNTSPFVIVYAKANVAGLPDLVNAVITVSVLSVGMSCVYAGSRTMLAMAEQGYLPRLFTYVDKAGRPLWAVLFILLFFPLAYINQSPDTGTQVFNWLIAISGLSTVFMWLSILLAHVRFRMAWKAQGHSVDELPFRALGGIWGSLLGAFILIIVLIAQFYIAAFPIGSSSDDDPAERVQSFFEAYISFPIVIVFVIGAYLWKRTRPLKLQEIDLVSGRKCWESAEELNVWRARTKSWPLYKRVLHTLFG